MLAGVWSREMFCRLGLVACRDADEKETVAKAIRVEILISLAMILGLFSVRALLLGQG